MTRKYTFELVIYDASDEFWDSEPSEKEVTAMISDGLSNIGIEIVGQGYDLARDTLKLKKLEILED